MRPSRSAWVRTCNALSRGGCQHLIHEPRLQRRLLGVERLHALLVGVAQKRAGSDEVLVRFLQQPQRFRAQALAMTGLVKGVHPREQLGIEVNGISMRGEPGRHLLLYLLQSLIGMGTRNAEERRSHTREQSAAPLQGFDGVAERRGLIGTGNGIDFEPLLGHARLKRRHIVFIADRVERRCTEGKRTRRIKRIVVAPSPCHCFRCYRLIHLFCLLHAKARLPRRQSRLVNSLNLTYESTSTRSAFDPPTIGPAVAGDTSMSSLRITRLVAFRLASSNPWPCVMASVGQASTQ